MNKKIHLIVDDFTNIPQIVINRTRHLLQYKPEKLLTTSVYYDKKLSRIHKIRHIEKIAQCTKHPLCLLSECWGKNCPNNRFINPYKRQKLVENTVKYIKLEHHLTYSFDDYFQIVFYGSGSLLQELIILHHLILSHSTLTLDILLVDPLYYDYCELVTKINKTVVILNHPYPILRAYPEIS